MMSRMGVVFFLLLLFALASTQQEGDVEARKIDDLNYRSRPGPFCMNRCSTNGRQCGGECNCSGASNCQCKYIPAEWACRCRCGSY
uniref:Conopeptide n=1 Tax=Conus lenavati TaxID=1519839 RepID=A0A0K8TU57_CONLV